MIRHPYSAAEASVAPATTPDHRRLSVRGEWTHKHTMAMAMADRREQGTPPAGSNSPDKSRFL
jgi:hypothetical protein